MTGGILASFPDPTQLFVTCSTETKNGMGLGMRLVGFIEEGQSFTGNGSEDLKGKWIPLRSEASQGGIHGAREEGR